MKTRLAERTPKLDQFGRPLVTVDGRGLTTTYIYDDTPDHSRVMAIPAPGPVSIVYDVTIAVDGNLTKITYRPGTSDFATLNWYDWREVEYQRR